MLSMALTPLSTSFWDPASVSLEEGFRGTVRKINRERPGRSARYVNMRWTARQNPCLPLGFALLNAVGHYIWGKGGWLWLGAQRHKRLRRLASCFADQPQRPTNEYYDRNIRALKREHLLVEMDGDREGEAEEELRLGPVRGRRAPELAGRT